MKRYIITLLSTAFLLSGCQPPSKPQPLIGGTLLFQRSAEQMRCFLKPYRSLFGNKSIHGVKGYKISYTTQGINGKPIRASGLIVIPDKRPSDGLSVISDSHGTTSYNHYVPTEWPRQASYAKQLQRPDIIYSSLGGFITARADYPGYGDSNSIRHPYLLKKYLVSDSLDFLRAVKIFAHKNHIKLNNKLFISGYSEGGFVAMALLKAIKEQSFDAFRLMAGAPMAGPYDMPALTDAIMREAQMDVPAYTAFTLYAYGQENHVDPHTVFSKKYADYLIDRFTLKDKTIAQINCNLPESLDGEKGLLRNDFIQAYRNRSSHWLRRTARQNDVSDWKPSVPIRLIHCRGDDVIPYAVAQSTLAKMQKHGARNVDLITADTKAKPLPHLKCSLYAYLKASEWFEEQEHRP